MAAGAMARFVGGGNAACWRVAGWIAGARLAWSAATGLAGAEEGMAATVAGTTLREIGRGFGSGTAAAASSDNAMTLAPSIRLAPSAVHRMVELGASRFTAFPRGESRQSPITHSCI
jgi:hypothetical protein